MKSNERIESEESIANRGKEKWIEYDANRCEENIGK